MAKSETLKDGRLFVTYILGVWIVLFVVLVGLQPFYGIMDDGGLLRNVLRAQAEGFFPLWQEFLAAEQVWGMFRPFYLPWHLPVSAFTWGNPVAYFALNAAIVLTWLGVFSWGWGRALFPRDGAAPVWILLGACLFPWTTDLFFHPSLQEKEILLAAGLSALVAGHRIFPLFLLALMFGFLQKPQFLIFVPSLILIEWIRTRSVGRVITASLVSLVAIVTLRSISLKGAYTGGFGLQNVPQNLKNAKAILLMGLAFGWGIFLVWSSRNKKWNEWTAGRLLQFSPSVIFLLFVAIFAQWGFAGYLLSLVGPIFGLLIAYIRQEFSVLKRKQILPILATISLAILGGRFFYLLSYWSELREILESSETLITEAKDSKIVLTCREGYETLDFYAKTFFRVTIPFTPTDHPPEKRFLVLADDRFCPGGEHVAARTPIWSPHPGSKFKLYGPAGN